MLRGIGLSDDEEQAYRLLLRHPSLTLAELADRMAAGPSEVVICVDHLVESGLAVIDQGPPPSYTPVDPRVGIPALVRARQAELERTTAAIASYAADYRERMLRADPHRLVEVLDGPFEVSTRLESLLRTAEHEVLAIDAPPYVGVDRTVTPGERALLRRGVSVRTVYASEALSIPHKLEVIREITTLGEEARVLSHVPLKMVVIDSHTAMVPLTSAEESTRTTAVVVGQSRLCDAMVALFEATWTKGTPVFDTSSSDVETDTPDGGRQLLDLLGTGMKDEAIARHLGISERTVRRRVSDLMSDLGVTSRFQAGVQALRRGWL